MAQANEEAARIRDLAREKSETLIQRDAITQAAQARAQSIIEQSRREALAVRDEADQYVLDVLTDLEDALMRTLGVVRNGITHVRDEKKQAQPAQQHPAPDEIDTPATLETPDEPMQIERISSRRD